MAKNTKQTSSKAASAAGKVLANPKSSKADKTAAGSALSQAPKNWADGRTPQRLRGEVQRHSNAG
jgi:hypothetical protein